MLKVYNMLGETEKSSDVCRTASLSEIVIVRGYRPNYDSTEIRLPFDNNVGLLYSLQ